MVQITIQNNPMKALKFLLLLSFLLLNISCSVKDNTKNMIPELIVGTGTDKGNEVQLIEFNFDNKWNSAKGNMSCCWGRRGGSQNHSNVIAPKKLKISWFDFEPERIFRAEISLSDDLFKYTQDLPSYYWVHQQEIETDISPNLAVSVGSSGEVVVWISNAATSRNKTGRVMYEVGRGQAICLPSINEGVPDNCQGLADEPKIKRPF